MNGPIEPDQLPLRLRARYGATCFAPPSPELRERWASELGQLRSSDATVGQSLDVMRKPRHLGFDDGVIIPPEVFPFGTPVATIRSAAADRAPLRGTVRVIVVLVDFSDKPMAQTKDHFHDLFFSSNKLPHGSVREYYAEVTNNLIDLDGDVVGPFRMPQTLAWYANGNFGIARGGGEFRSPQLAHDAAVAADPTVDFGPYDNDGNGYVDAFIVVHAGAGAEVTGNSGDIWSHKATLSSAYGADGTQVFGYLTIPEDSKIGVCAHELGHLLFGFPDLYDTDYTSEGVGNWCLMSGGTWNGGGDVPAHPSAWCKVNQGWVSVTNVTAGGSVTIPDVKTSKNVLRLWKDGGAGAEYFLVENRQREHFDADLPGDGLLVWHIDDSQSGNTDENHYQVGLIQADGQRDLELNHNRGDGGDPFPGSHTTTALGSGTTPGTKSYAGQDTCVSLTNITASAAIMTATVTVRCKVIRKSPIRDFKARQKEHKEIEKNRISELKVTRKDVKEYKEHKEIEKQLNEKFLDRPGGGGFGRTDMTGEDVLASLEARMSNLEQLIGVADEPFIGSELRPDLSAPSQRWDANYGERMAAGDRDAKREYDSPIR